MTVQHSTFLFENIEIKKFNFEQISEICESETDEIVALQIGQQISASSKLYDETMELLLNVKIEVSQFNNVIYYISSILKCTVKITKNEAFKPEKIKTNIAAILYSYLRPLVAQMTVLAKLPPLDIPPLNFQNLEIKDIDRDLDILETSGDL